MRTPRGREAGPYVRFAVSDTGCGMDAATQARSSSRSSPPRRKAKGTALGSLPCMASSRQSGGTIWVYSEPGQGTTFKILSAAGDLGQDDGDCTRLAAVQTPPTGN